MAFSASQAPGDTLSRRSEAASESGSVIGFKGSQAGVEQLAARYDDDVKPRCNLVIAENLTDQSFRAISLDGAAELLRRRDTQPPGPQFVGKSKDSAEPAADPDTALVDAFKIGPPSNSLALPKAPVDRPLQIAATRY
jgi:hypothetical protein